MILRDTVTRLRPSWTSGPYGTRVPDWTSPASATYAAQVSATSSVEVLGDEARTVIRFKLFAGPDADIAATDRIVWNGATYEVDGEVMPSRQPGYLHHIRAYLRKVTTQTG